MSTASGSKTEDEITHVWARLVVRDGVTYSINREHPLAGHVFDLLDDQGDAHLEQLLESD